MIKVKQSRKLMNHCRTLTIKDDIHDTECKKDVLRVLSTDGTEIFLLDIEKDGTINIWSNTLSLHVDTEI